MKLLFILQWRADAGSIQAVASYVQVGNALGHEVAVYGRPGVDFPGLPCSLDAERFDHVVFIFESLLQWMRPLQAVRLLAGVPPEKRVVLDADGMLNDTIVVDGYDRNHLGEDDRQAWATFLGQLGGTILQPTLARPRQPDALALPFYGYDPGAVVRPGPGAKPYDVLYVGHNWWRWKEFNDDLLPAIERVRQQIGPICFLGLWWDVEAPRAGGSPYEMAFRVDGRWLRRLGIQVRPPVPYTDVIPTMGQARVNVMTQRPLLRHLKHLTSKYFELFCADTVPLVMLDPEHAVLVYGPAGRELALYPSMPEGIGGKLVDVLERPERYQAIVADARRHLVAHHSYHQRVRELMAALESPAEARPM